MRLLRGIVALMLGLAFVVAGATSASAAETYHGTFQGGTGYNVGGVAPYFIAEGDHSLDMRGTWNVTVSPQGVQVVGVLMTATRYQDCGLPPCPWGMNLQAGEPWVETAPGVFSSTFDTGLVQFDRTLDTNVGAEYVLTMAITGCPYGWQQWSIPGTSRVE